MKITINDHRKIFAIQEEFTNAFPYLKIEFFAKAHQSGGPAAGKFVNPGATKISECRTIHNDGDITITENMSVKELERRFADVYGLAVQVFRKSGNMWLETSITSDWTLGEQNKEGENLNDYFTDAAEGN